VSCDVSEAVLVGLCSGADIALRYGHTDPRVAGLVLLDPAVPPTARFYLDYIFRRMTRLRSWLTFARGGGRIWGDLVGRMALAVGTRPAAWDGGLIDPRTRDELEDLYRRTVERDVRMFVALTGGDLAGRQTYREQLLDAFPTVPFRDKLRLEYFADSDHMFAPPRDRELLNAMIMEWLADIPMRRTRTEASPELATPIRRQVRYGM
jgi:dienelactone hydrolase